MLIQQTSADTDLALANMEARLSQKLDANKIDELQRQVDKLQLEQATSGMLRFPSSWSYGAGQFPPIFGGCNCQGNI
jgi:hypothetical protein